MVHAFFNPSQAAVFNALASKRDSTFEFQYFGLHGLGAISRIILAAAGAKFTNNVPADWPSEKPKAPFGVMPLLTETSSDKKTTIHVSESDAIERYLAKKFGMAGDDAFEETVVNTFAYNTHSLMMRIFEKYFTVKDETLKAENKKQLLEGAIADWIAHHEKHLVANGSNGHYLGNKTTIADIKTSVVLSMVEHIGAEKELISEKKTPALWKVRSEVNDIPSFVQWRATEEYKSFAERTFSFLGYY